MYKVKEISTREAIIVTACEYIETGLRQHRIMKSRVKKFVFGEMCGRLFLAKMVFMFGKRFIMDTIVAFAICALLDISNWYMLIYIVVRIALFANTLIRMFMDVASK